MQFGGHRLRILGQEPCTQGIFVCSESIWRYKEKEPEALRCLDWAEDQPPPVMELNMEAQLTLSGRPVVAPSVGGLPETVADGECGILFKASEEASVVDAMETVASKLLCYDPETIAAHCRFRFSYESVGKSLASLYESFAQN